MSSSSSSSSSSSPPPPSDPPSDPDPETPRSPLRPIYLTLLLSCPILLLLPPRKLDLYTFSLCSAWALSAESLASETRPGWGVRAWAEARRKGKRRASEEGEGGDGEKIRGEDGDRGERDGEEEKGAAKSLLRNLWMGDEKPGWQRRRLEREREELESGKSYGGIIMGQVREVFPGWGRGRGRGEEGDGEGEGEGEKEGEGGEEGQAKGR